MSKYVGIEHMLQHKAEVRLAKELVENEGYLVIPKDNVKSFKVSAHVPYWSSLEIDENIKYKGYLRETLGRMMAHELIKAGVFKVDEDVLPDEEGSRFSAKLEVVT